MSLINPQRSIEELTGLGFSSIRTTGGTLSRAGFGGNASQACENISTVKEQVNRRMTILLAGGIEADNVAELMEKSGIHHIHCGRGVRIPQTADGAVDVEKVRVVRKIQMETIGKFR